MIKFFRRIRQRLLSENKISKYLFYAIGEVVLVVIGILIALSINNWNENRKNAALESYYLNSLRSNIIQDTTNYGIKLRDINRTLKELDSAAIKLNLDSNQELWTDKAPRIFMSTFNVNSETSVIEDLKSTGNLSLISNKKIIDSVLVYYKGIDETKVGINNSIQTYARETIGPYLMMKYEVAFNGQTVYSWPQQDAKAPYSKQKWKGPAIIIGDWGSKILIGYQNQILQVASENVRATSEVLKLIGSDGQLQIHSVGGNAPLTQVVDTKTLMYLMRYQLGMQNVKGNLKATDVRTDTKALLYDLEIPANSKCAQFILGGEADFNMFKKNRLALAVYYIFRR